MAQAKAREHSRPAFVQCGDWASEPSLQPELRLLRDLQKRGLKAMSSPNHRGPQLEYQHFHLTYEDFDGFGLNGYMHFDLVNREEGMGQMINHLYQDWLPEQIDIFAGTGAPVYVLDGEEAESCSNMFGEAGLVCANSDKAATVRWRLTTFAKASVLGQLSQQRNCRSCF